MKVIYFTKSVSIIGGKEKVLAGLANHLAANGYTVEIVTFDGSLQSAFNLAPAIKITTRPLSFLAINGGLVRKTAAFFKDVRAYRAHNCSDADFMIATDQVVASILYYAFKAKRHNIIVWEHITHALPAGRFWGFVRKYVYPRIKLVVALNKEEAAHYKKQGCEVACIPNGIKQQPSPTNNNSHVLAWAGALTPDKGMGDIIQLAKLLKQNSLPITIHVYGTSGVEAFKEEAGALIDDVIVVKQPVKDISAIYTNAAALLVTSKHECFPTVILEAFSFGRPIIAYDCPTGPRNIVTDNVDGMLVAPGDINGLYNAAVKFFTTKGLLQQMGEKAYASSQKYTVENMYSGWEALLR